MNFPADLRYTKEHEWIRIHADGQTATVGITEFAQSELGDIVYVEVETLGETIKNGAIFGTIEAVKTTSDLFMPLDAKVLEVNPKITAAGADDPELVNSDPYGDGWIIKVLISDPHQLKGLLTHEEYKTLVH